MGTPDEDSLREAGRLPKGRLARTARVGGLVTGQGLRWAGMRTANRIRTPERATAAQKERTAALVQQLVDQLGQMRGRDEVLAQQSAPPGGALAGLEP